MLPETLIQQLNALGVEEKREAMAMLAAALHQETTPLPGGVYALWSPFDSAAAADVLSAMLAEDKHSHA